MATRSITLTVGGDPQLFGIAEIVRVYANGTGSNVVVANGSNEVTAEDPAAIQTAANASTFTLAPVVNESTGATDYVGVGQFVRAYASGATSPTPKV